MNKPPPSPAPEAGIGPVDEHGTQIWSPEEQAAIERMERDPAFQARMEEARADVSAGRVLSHDQHLAELVERKRRWFAERDG